TTLATGLTAGRAGALLAGIRLLTAALLALAAAPVATATAAALGLGDLCGGVFQRWADLVGLHLHDGALLALRRVPGAGDEAAGDDHAGAASQRLGGVLGRLTPDRAAHE